MRFTISTAALLAFASSALAQVAGFDTVTSPAQEEHVTAGQTYNIQWTTADDKYPGAVTLTLLGGASPTTLQILGDIAAGIDNAAGSYQWNVKNTLGNDAYYGIKISWAQNGAIFNYGFPFHIDAAAVPETTSSTPVVITTSKAATTTPAGPAITSSTPVEVNIDTQTVTVDCETATGNWTSPGSHQPTTILTQTPVSVGPSSHPSNPAFTHSPIPTAAGANVRAGSLAVLGGLAAALFFY